MSGGRIVSHGKIESLSDGFRLPNGELFTIYIRPKGMIDDFSTILSVKCYQDNDFSDAPFLFEDWSPLAISEIAPNEDVLSNCDIYWGSGQYAGEDE